MTIALNHWHRFLFFYKLIIYFLSFITCPKVNFFIFLTNLLSENFINQLWVIPHHVKIIKVKFFSSQNDFFFLNERIFDKFLKHERQ